MDATGVAVVVVTYNSAPEVGPCLDAALSFSRPGIDVVMAVDNASEDDTLALVRRRPVELIANPVNCGFAAAVNQAVRATNQEFILLLNPDAVLLTSFHLLTAASAEPGVAGAGGKLVGSDGRPQRGFVFRSLPTPTSLAFEVLGLNRLFPANPVNWHYRCLDVTLDHPSSVEQPAGALLMFRRSVWEELGGFDEGFFPVWFEDVDFAARARRRGLSFRYLPDVVAVHTGAHSIRKIELEKRELYWYGSLLRYTVRHFSVAGRRSVALAVIAGSVLRMVAGILVHRSLTSVRVYAAVCRLASRLLARPEA